MMDNRYDNYADADIHAEIENAKAQIKAWKNVIERLEDEVAKRYQEKIANAKAANPDKATVRVDAQEGFEVKGETKKTVKYDNKILTEAAQGMDWNKFNTIFKMTLKVPENVYSALNAMALDEGVREKIEAARTVEYKETVTLIKLEE